MQAQVDLIQKLIDKMIDFLVTYSFQVLGALVVLFLGFKVAGWAARWLVKLLERRQFDETLSRFAAGLLRGLIIGFAILVALGNFGITITPLVAALSAIAFGGTFAIQGPLSNYGSGLSLLLARPFKVGDIISVVGVTGTVEEVTLAGTTLSTADERITIPNKHIVGEVLHKALGFKLVAGVVGIGYRDDPEQAVSVIRSTLERLPDVARTPAPLIGIQDFWESSINIGLRYWAPTRQYLETVYAANLAIFKALKQAGITMPFPQRDLHIISEPEGSGYAAAGGDA